MENRGWQDVLGSIKKRVKPTEYRNWFSVLKLVELSDGLARVMVKDGRFQEFFSQRYQSILEEELERQFGMPFVVEYSVADPELFDYQPSPKRPVAELPPYTFDDFVQGPSNLMAYAASKAASERPGRAYNPLFIYGGVGLGKTHLMCAIGNHALKESPGLRVLYTSCETWVNELMAAIRAKRWDQFRAQYRDQMDMLLVDDIHFLAGKERTQAEFFHLFNALHAAKKQIVFTCDRPPHEIPQLEERLKSRFEWGLIADIKPPELETRVAIVQKKSEKLFGAPLSLELAVVIAEEMVESVRELEGCLMRLQLEKQLNKAPASTKAMRDFIRSYHKKQFKKISVEAIQKAVATKYGVAVEELVGASRRRELSQPRHVAMYLARKLTGSSLPEIGRKFGDRDHSSVLAGCRNVEKALRLDNRVVLVVDELESRFRR